MYVLILPNKYQSINQSNDIHVSLFVNNSNLTNFVHFDWLFGRLYTSIKAMRKDTLFSTKNGATLRYYVTFLRKYVDVTKCKRHKNNG